MEASQLETGELQNVLRRIENAMEKCKKENYSEALNVYHEPVKEEPRDFRPYLCQGTIYILLRKTEEAAKSFEKYQKLVPKDHPYHRYFEDNMMATKDIMKAGTDTSAVSTEWALGELSNHPNMLQKAREEIN
ncbi:hypothetical protein C5167_044887 [Papaver somniferum]|uniref:Uncharacterized protein n=1 Tax=Papaver somniferum TaxID=3469 RepID=A0A4Y7L9F1_PAPSO|nr:hypothetical protein C5167_044887 [Papaver somniferum]